jgi:thiol-disulfide isomerase/thioredoxin|tara:strand:+ start:5399 stop:6469 length:1071 start_codon:yes stop_codon:yes gene_type:complete
MKNFKFYFFIFLTLFILSCEGEYEEVGTGSGDPSNPVTTITLSVSSENVSVNTEVVFQILSDSNNVLTSSCKFFVNDKEISGNKYTPGEEGDYTVYATYLALKSNIKTFNASVKDATFKTNILVEDFTGAWCGYCPRVAYKLKELEKKTTQLITVAAHQGDAFEYSKINEMMTAFSIGGFPTAKVNRSIKWNESESQILNLITNDAKVGLALEIGEPDESTGDQIFKVKVKFTQDYSSSNLKLVVFILKDNLIADQRNYADFGYGADDPLKDFVHDNVLVVGLPNMPMGEAIPSASTKNGTTYSKSFTINDGTYPDGYDDAEMHLVAFVVKEDKSVINARIISDLGVPSNQTFEEM